MRFDYITYGPHSSALYSTFYFYNETSLQYGYILNDSNDSISWGVAFEKTGTISGIGMYIIEKVGNPDYVLGIVTVSGTPGSAEDSLPNINPTTKVGEMYSNSQWQPFEPDSLSLGWNWVDLSTQVNVTKGDHAAITIIPSGSVIPDGSNYTEINDESTFWTPFPGSWRYSTYWSYYNWNPPISVKYTDGNTQGFAIVGLPWEEFSSPEEWGVEFQIPFQATCIGATINLYPVNTAPGDAPFKIILADSSDTELASRTISDYDIVDSYNNNNVAIVWDTSIDPVLSPSTIYRLYLKPTSSEPLDKKGFILESEASRSDLPCGSNWKWIERPAPASGWTYHPTYYPWISVNLIDITGVGGNGGSGTGQSNSSYGFIG